MPHDAARTLLRVLEVFRPAFRPAAFARWLLVLTAWLLCSERHAVIECLVSGAAGLWEHSAFDRVFFRRRWDLDPLGQLWLLHLVAFLEALGVPWQLTVDYTNRTVLRGLLKRVTVLSLLDLRAALTDPSGRVLASGRCSKKKCTAASPQGLSLGGG